jgi:hypothetical protein
MKPIFFHKKLPMKKLIITSLIFTLFSFAKCSKEKIDNNGLPPPTETGKNTLGFFLNGEPWTPQGFSGTANLSIDYDPNFNNGILGIVAYRTISSNDKTQFIIGIADSLNFLIPPVRLFIKKKSIAGASYSNKNYCDINHNDTTIFNSGELTLTKLDKTNRIIAGTFDAILYKPDCGDTVKITQGRFDMKY